MERLLRVGVIASTHGVRGEVKIYPTTDDLRRFRRLKDVILITQAGEELPLHVEGVKFFKQTPILKFREFDDIDAITPYRGCDLMVTRQNAVPLAENEYYIGDLLGMKVIADTGEELGTLSDVIETGANDVYVVSRPGMKELLLPVIDECILDVDTEAGIVKAHIMEGLLDL